MRCFNEYGKVQKNWYTLFIWSCNFFPITFSNKDKRNFKFNCENGPGYRNLTQTYIMFMCPKLRKLARRTSEFNTQKTENTCSIKISKKSGTFDASINKRRFRHYFPPTCVCLKKKNEMLQILYWTLHAYNSNYYFLFCNTYQHNRLTQKLNWNSFVRKTREQEHEVPRGKKTVANRGKARRTPPVLYK